MEDVFGGLLGGPPPGDRGSLDALGAALDGARLWGLELDLRYRVLAATVEPRQPAAFGIPGADDPRLQMLCFPVSTILAALRRKGDDGSWHALTFTDDQLLDVVASLDGPRLSAPLFGEPEPLLGAWGPRFSLEGRSSAPDGTRSTLTIRVQADDLELDVFVRFDDVELKDVEGRDVAVPAAGS